jgi:Right handed beta helix region
MTAVRPVVTASRPARWTKQRALLALAFVAGLGACSADDETPLAPSNPDVQSELALASASASSYYVSPSGSSSGDGSTSRPWDLRSVLSGSKSVPAGSTVWVRGGTYSSGELVSWVSGVTIRQYGQERATINGNLVIQGANTTFWGLEVMSSNPTSTGKMGVNVRAPGVKLINLVVHDAGMSGIGTWMESPNSEVYGSLVYNNGTHYNLDHGIYAQNSSGTKALRDNILFNNLAYGFHLYTSSGQYTRNMTLEGNVSFNNGTIGKDGWRPDFLVGGSTAASGIAVRENYSYRNDRKETADMGYSYGPTNQDLTFTDNYLVGSLHLGKWQSVNQARNTIITSSTPSATKVVVRPNKYEAGRANIVVYNWGKQSSVSVSLVNVLKSGDRYEVRNAQDFYGTPVVKGTYSGGSVSIPMLSMQAVKPIGRSTASAPSTGSTFGVYVVVKTS